MGNKLTAGVIGASSESIYAIEEAKKRNIKVVAIDGNPDAPGLQYADEGYVIDISDIDRVFQFFETKPIDFLLPVPVGRILTISGAVNEKFKLPGIGASGANASTDKWEFHQLLSKAGLRNAEAILLNDSAKLSTVANMRFPIIIKPRFGSGSRDVKAYDSYGELLDDFKSIEFPNEDFIAETCREGTEYGVDAMVFNGDYRMILLREKILTPLPYRQCVGYYSIVRNPNTERLISAIDELVRKSIAILGINNCLLHADVIYDGDEAFLIEISPRPSGHHLHNCFTRYACGFDMLSAYMDFASSIDGRDSYVVDYEYGARSMLIKYFDLDEGVIEALPRKEEIERLDGVILYECLMHTGDVVGRVTDGKSVMGRGFYIVEAPSLASCNAICEEVERRIVIRGE